MNAIVTTSGNNVSISGTTTPNAAVEAIFRRNGQVIQDINSSADATGFASGSITLQDGTYQVTINFPGGSTVTTIILPDPPPGHTFNTGAGGG
jgi:hypothetical protein